MADISTRVCFKHPSEIPWFSGDLKIDERFHTSPVGQNVANLPDVKRQEVTVQNQASSVLNPVVTLQNLLTVKLPLELKTTVERKKHKSFELIEEILTRNEFSRAINILARIFQLFNKSLDLHDSQEKAKEKIVGVYQNENQEYIKSFRGNIFSKITPVEEGKPTMLQVRENQMGQEFLYLVPKQCLLNKKLIEHFHKVTDHGSDLYIRMWAIREGFYIPNALPALAKYRRSCLICRKRADVRVVIKMGHVGDRQLITGFMETVCSDFCGPFLMKNPVNQRATRKYWLMITIDDMSRFITVTLVEDLTAKAILRAIQKHRFRFGPTRIIHSDMGTNYVGAQRILREQSEDVVDPAVMKAVQEAAKSFGVTIITRVAKAPYMMGSAERSVAVVKKLWPKCNMHYFEVEFMCEKAMHCINMRPLSLSNAGQSLCPNDLRPMYNHSAQNDKSSHFVAGHEKLQKTIEDFERNWEEIYQLSIISMKKWLRDSIILQKGDLVAVSDIKPGYQQLAIVEKVSPDTNGHNRYFTISYVSNEKRKLIDRPGSSLTFLLSNEERKCGKVRDSLSYLPEEVKLKHKTKVRVTVPIQEEQIVNLTQ